MILEVHEPGPPLGRFVENLVFYEGYEPLHTKEKLLPDGAVEVIVDLTETPKHLYDRDDWSKSRSFRHSWISGMRRGYIVIEASPRASMAVIRFRPGGAFPFLAMPVSEITDVVTELDDVLGAADAAILRERILETGTPSAKFAAIERFLLDRARGRLESDPAVDYLVARLADPGEVTIAGLVNRIGYSHRHTLGLFRKWVGLAPKQYCRIRKFQQVVHRIQEAREVDWASIAIECGYYDQSHFIHEFRTFSGLAPGEYLGARGEHVNYLPLD